MTSGWFAQAVQPTLPQVAFEWTLFGTAILFFVAGAIACKRQNIWIANRFGKFAVPLAAAFAFALSCGYVRTYLHGQPRIIDATTYYLQAASLARGNLGLELPGPTQWYGGRFLFPMVNGKLTGIFPIGYPVVLSLGFRIGAPMLVGPTLALLIVLMTSQLGKEVASHLHDDESVAKKTGLAAALLSACCICLRYHTADTMSHGLSALLMTASCLGLLRMCKGGTGQAWLTGVFFALTTAFLGYTRPVSTLPLIAVALSLVLTKQSRRGALVGLVGFAILMLPLLLLHRFQTGSATTNMQTAYYAASDYPFGCFRYGFGKGVGCRFEHGDYVSHALPDGYTLLAAIKALGRRVWMHLGDATNGLAPLAACCILAILWRLRKQAGATARRQAPRLTPRRYSARVVLFAVIVLQALAYVPFYFDGNYPGGGGRFLADILPLEHVLLATILVPRHVPDQLARWRERSLAPTLMFASVMLFGFCLHHARHHRQLRDRDGGYAWAPPVPSACEMVFVEGDHAFNTQLAEHIAPHPWSTESEYPPPVRRLRGDRFDLLVLGTLPPSSLHHACVLQDGIYRTYRGPTPPDRDQYRPNSYWPLRTENGSAVPCDKGPGCLRLVPHEGGPMRARFCKPNVGLARDASTSPAQAQPCRTLELWSEILIEQSIE
jgi:hypothetical protein